MSEEEGYAAMLLEARQELEKNHTELRELSHRLEDSKREDASERLTVTLLTTLHGQLDDIKGNFRIAAQVLTKSERDTTLRTKDEKNKKQMMREYEKIRSTIIQLAALERAMKQTKNVNNSIIKLEKGQAENPGRNYSSSIATLHPQITELKQLALEADVEEEHLLQSEIHNFEDRIFNLMSAEPSVIREERKPIDIKSSYKVTALAIPKFDGKIQGWVAFWQEFEYAIHKKDKLEDAVKMVYLKQAITDPGLNTTISDLGIEPGSYAAAIKMLHDRFD